MSTGTQLVIFDIDGTLTNTTSVDDALFAQTIESVCGFKDFDQEWGNYDHTTDSGILAQLYRERCGRSARREELDAFIAHFCGSLQKAYARNPQSITAMPGANRILTTLTGHDAVVGIATGGWQKSARFKLQCAGIPVENVFASFADDAVARKDIIGSTVAQASRAHNRSWAPHQITYVGDGFWDYKATVELGINFIGVLNDKIRSLEGIQTITHFDRLPAVLFS